MPHTPLIVAGIPATNFALYHRTRFAVGDPAAYIETIDPEAGPVRTLIVRDIEMQRARRLAHIDHIACPADFAPESGLSGDRETATAQAAAECLRRAGVTSVTADRTLALIYVHHLIAAGIEVVYDPELGVRQRRVKSDEELEHLRKAQAVTEEAMRFACEMIAGAEADREGVLLHDGATLTSERVRRAITMFLLERGFSNSDDSIVATAPHVAECHHHGTGPLQTGLPVVIDIFPRDDSTRYRGDCTRTVVHGEPADAVVRMHAAVLDAKHKAIAALRPGVTGNEINRLTWDTIRAHGYEAGPPDDAQPSAAGGDAARMPHGTGHGIGLEVHEPILLAEGGGEILEREVFTVEPGLYCRRDGGVRVEDMVAVTDAGCENFNHLHEGLDWR